MIAVIFVAVVMAVNKARSNSLGKRFDPIGVYVIFDFLPLFSVIVGFHCMALGIFDEQAAKTSSGVSSRMQAW